eukprot:2768994-Karenia_brevis.AAC.1
MHGQLWRSHPTVLAMHGHVWRSCYTILVLHGRWSDGGSDFDHWMPYPSPFQEHGRDEADSCCNCKIGGSLAWILSSGLVFSPYRVELA